MASDLILPGYHGNLDLADFSNSLKDPSQCYKFYWLESIMILLRDHNSEKRRTFTFEEIIDRMIANAWYTVSYYHLHMGPGRLNNPNSDQVEHAVMVLDEAYRKKYHTEIPYQADKEQLISYIHEFDSQLHDIKMTLTLNVPYRLLSPFLVNVKGRQWNNLTKILDLINEANQNVTLPYVIQNGKGMLKRTVVVNEEWAQLLLSEYNIVMDWIQYGKVQFLQNMNPNVPGIINKLEPYTVRKLDDVKKLWKAVLKNREFMDIYSGKLMSEEKYDIDHFVPWSYVSNDELWNLIPALSSLNRQKSNHLPAWNQYGDLFLKNQLGLYEEIHRTEHTEELFQKCRKDNLHSDWADVLYQKGHSAEQFLNALAPKVKNQYDAASLQGFRQGSFVTEKQGQIVFEVYF